jgi:long-chain acyl-CoA synthetase
LRKKFGSWEKIKRFELTADVWSIDGGQLTPTLKLKEKLLKSFIKNSTKKYSSIAIIYRKP